MKKVFVYILFLLVSLSFVSGITITPTSSDFNIVICNFTGGDTISDCSNYSNGGEMTFSDGERVQINGDYSNNYAFFFPISEDYSMARIYFSGRNSRNKGEHSFGSYNKFNFDLVDEEGKKKNFSQVTLSSFENNVVELSSNLVLKNNTGSDLKLDNDFFTDFDSYLKRNFYMKTFVFMKISNDNGKSVFIYPDNVETDWYGYNTEDQMNSLDILFQTAFDNLSQDNKVKYVLAKPSLIKINFTNNLNSNKLYLQEKCNNGDINYCGNYSFSVYAIPIDGKLDFNGDNELSSLEFGIAILNLDKLIIIFKDSDYDGFDDIGDYGRGHDDCPTLKGSYNGCPLYTNSLNNENITELKDCSGVLYNYKKIDKYKDSEIYKERNSRGYGYFKIKETSSDSSGLPTPPSIPKISNDYTFPKSLSYKNPGSGIYTCKKEIGDNNYKFDFYLINYHGDKGFCSKLFRINGEIKNVVLKYGEYMEVSDIGVILNKEEKSNDLVLENISCENPRYDYTNKNLRSPIVLEKEFDEGFKRGGGGFIIPENKIRGIACNFEEDVCAIKYENKGYPRVFSLPHLNNQKTIKRYKNGVLVSQENTNLMKLALLTNKIRIFLDPDKAFDYIKRANEITSKFDVIINATYDSVQNKTNINLVLNGDSSQPVSNLTVYQIFSKDELPNLDNLSYSVKSGVKLIVVDKDPVIGWYFNDSISNAQINITIPGDSDGGVILITQEPILYNDGELIINYREGKTGCAEGEAHLFDLEDLEDSVVKDKNQGNYQICVGDINSSIKLYPNSAHLNKFNISSYTLNSFMSLNYSQLSNKVNISTDIDHLYWDMRVQKLNPSGNYSCLGSIDDVNNPSKFGDCDYKPENRIWIHLGADYYPPVTKIDYPFVSHKIKINFMAKDEIGGSGFANLTYKVDDGNWVSVDKENYTLTLTCPNDSGCSKHLQYYSTDLEGNKETIHRIDVRVLDKGTACLSSCLAKPTPNRYLKECDGVNGCHFYNQNVAKSCDLKNVNSVVKFNSTNDITCPNGPFVKSRYSSNGIKFKNSKCNNIIKIPYNVIVNGENLIMNIITCADNN